MFTDLLNALGHGAVYALAGGAMLVLAYYVLDVLTPGTLGEHLAGAGETSDVTAREIDGMRIEYAGLSGPSYSAAVVTATWLIGTGAVLFTAIWTNGDTDLGWALLWTALFGLLGIILNTIMLVAIDLATPGNLRAIICQPGPALPLAYVAAAGSLAVSAIVAASIA